MVWEEAPVAGSVELATLAVEVRHSGDRDRRAIGAILPEPNGSLLLRILIKVLVDFHVVFV